MVARAGHGAHPGHPQTVLEGSRTLVENDLACRLKPSAVLVAVDTVGAGDIFGAAPLAALVERDALKPGATRSL
jgi:hypothetical protein